jgi:hypothetical protein
MISELIYKKKNRNFTIEKSELTKHQKSILKDALRFVVNSLILCINSNTKSVNSRQIEGHPEGLK